MTNDKTSLTLRNGVTLNYGYDAASQLTAINYMLGSNTLGNLTYAYDLAGRRTGVGGSYARTGTPQAASTATYNVNNQLTQWKGASLTYDANGNLTGDGTNTYTWNARNQLVTISGGASASFQYDPFGRRVSKTIGGTTQYLYDGANPVQELSGTTASANLLTGGVDEYFQRTDLAGARAFLTDALGSTLALTDSTGTVQTSYTFEPFGNTITTGTATTNSFAYTGRELDSTGLYFYRARYYNPSLQRFISEDPLGQQGGINVYAYAFNDPVDLTDPFGLCGTPWDRVKLGLKGAGQLLVAGGKIVEGVAGIAAAPETGGLSLALSGYALASVGQNLGAAAGDIGGAITGDIELAEKFEQGSAAFGTASGLLTYAKTRDLGKAAFAGNVEGVAMMAFGAGVGKPFSPGDILKAPAPQLPEVPGLIKAYDAFDTTQNVFGQSDLGHRKNPEVRCHNN